MVFILSMGKYLYPMHYSIVLYCTTKSEWVYIYFFELILYILCIYIFYTGGKHCIREINSAF